ncbi:MAG: GIY-YIG nuclease family protein [Gemmataceae bacterium]
MTRSLARRGFSIRVYLADGLPDGLRIVDTFNWTGKAIVSPRSRFPEAKSRPEFDRTGVYVLRGPSESGDLPTVYIGEGDPTRPRLESHYAKKDFWTQLILFTSKDESLNKAHVQYLESRLVSLARDAKRCVLDNRDIPQLPSLAESDTAEMETFLEQMLLVFPLLGLSAFDVPRIERPFSPTLYIKSKGIVARGHDEDEGFVVLAGSQAVKEEVTSIHNYLVDMRASMKGLGILVESGEFLKLTQDYTFDSPSTAAGVILGRSANGRTEWQDDQGRTLKAIQEAVLGRTSS